MTTDFQVRHLQLGVFQGRACCRLAWYPTNPIPAVGFQRFDSRSDAEAFIAAVCELHAGTRPEEFVIEPFQLAAHCQIVRADLARARLCRMIRSHFAFIERQRRRI